MKKQAKSPIAICESEDLHDDDQSSHFFENKYWVATFKRLDKKGYAVARHIFGKPSNFQLKIKRVNPKRLQREVKKKDGEV